MHILGNIPMASSYISKITTNQRATDYLFVFTGAKSVTNKKNVLAYPNRGSGKK